MEFTLGPRCDQNVKRQKYYLIELNSGKLLVLEVTMSRAMQLQCIKNLNLF